MYNDCFALSSPPPGVSPGPFRIAPRRRNNSWKEGTRYTSRQRDVTNSSCDKSKMVTRVVVQGSSYCRWFRSTITWAVYVATVGNCYNVFLASDGFVWKAGAVLRETTSRAFFRRKGSWGDHSREARMVHSLKVSCSWHRMGGRFKIHDSALEVLQDSCTIILALARTGSSQPCRMTHSIHCTQTS